MNDHAMNTGRRDVESVLRCVDRYAARGWHVFPLVPGTKRPAVRGWEHWATTDRHHLQAWPGGVGVGIACGPSGLVVVDLDTTATTPAGGTGTGAEGERDGLTNFQERCGRHGADVPVTYTVRTPRGGWHLYFTHPTDPQVPELRNTAGTLAPRVDTRAHGGYVVAPPTVLTGPCRGIYTVARDVPVAPLPPWLTAALTPASLPGDKPSPVLLGPASAASAASAGSRQDRARAYLDAAVNGELRRVADAVEGQRNRSLFIAAAALGQLVAGGALTAAEVRGLLRAAAAPHIRARAYTAHEAEATIRSGLRVGARRPRRIAS